MRNLFFISLILVVALTMFGCSGDAPPFFRIRNERSTKASMQVKTSNGNTININNIEPGSTSEYQASTEGLIEITVIIQGESVVPTASFNAVNNGRYTIVILAGTTPALRID